MIALAPSSDCVNLVGGQQLCSKEFADSFYKLMNSVIMHLPQERQNFNLSSELISSVVSQHYWPRRARMPPGLTACNVLCLDHVDFALCLEPKVEFPRIFTTQI